MEKLFHTDKRYFLPFFILLAIFSLAVIFKNNELFVFINQTIASSTLDFVFSYVLIPLFLLLGIVPFFMLFFKGYRQLSVFCLISGFLCSQIGSLSKLLFSLPRPDEFLDVRLVGDWQVSAFTFPSTTVMLAFGLALPILLEKPKLSPPFLIIASLVGFAVIYSGYHFPYDVAAGMLFALFLVLLFKQIKNWAVKKFNYV
ncbi:phosphatase PAP2 family protein [Candidatus Parcubacteria bacterium]|nr:phosphatase PAP2 family protein [Candidatus Parcubacteria bacterium]